MYRQLQPPKTLWRIWEEKSAQLFEKTERTKVIASNTDLGTARGRHVSCTLLRTRDIDTVAQLIRESAARVVFVHGESGSGKTVCAARAANCLNDPVVVFYIRCDAPDANWEKSERDAQARAYVKAKVEAALGCRPGVTCTTTTRVIIILDEMGQHPQLARGICATRGLIADEIRAYLMLEGKPVNIVCVGTGVEGTDMARFGETTVPTNRTQATIMRSSCSTPQRRLMLMSWCLQQNCPTPMSRLSLTKWGIPQRSCCKAFSPRSRRACATTSFE